MPAGEFTCYSTEPTFPEQLLHQKQHECSARFTRNKQLCPATTVGHLPFKSQSNDDLAGNLKNDGTQVFTYDATGQQTEVKVGGVATLQQWYDGDRLREKKVEAGETTYYVRSSVLGGQVIETPE